MAWKNRPEINITLEWMGYNELILALKGNTTLTFDPDTTKTAQRLMDNIEKYAHFCVDDDGMEIADVGFFKSDAILLIWQLLIAHSRLSEISDDDAYHDLLERRAAQEKEESGDGISTDGL